MFKKLYSKIIIWLRQFTDWMVHRPYRKMARTLIDRLATFFHWLLFDVFLHKTLRNMTKKDIYTIIFKADTPAGKRFDILLLVAIVVNVVVLAIDSMIDMPDLMLNPETGLMEPTKQHQTALLILRIVEWIFNIMFTLEYYLRCYCLKKPLRYVNSFYGWIDLLSIVPPYLSLVFPAAQSFTVLRLLRMLRIFRIFDMKSFVQEGRSLIEALKRSATKILIFMLFVYIAAVILGTMMYAVESHRNPEVFSSIPSGIYWAVVTITTVGYGDMTPITPTGRFLSIVVMILGYSIIAVPTGIVAGETLVEHQKTNRKKRRKLRLEGRIDEEEEEEIE